MKTIKDMPPHSRPREKLKERGSAALADEELVAAILGMGTVGVEVRTIARQVAGLIREHRDDLTLEHLLTIGLLDKSPVHPREVFADGFFTLNNRSFEHET